MRRIRKIRTSASKDLPHRENGSPAGTSTGGPRATTRQGSGTLEDRCWYWPSVSCRASTGTGAPTASLSLLGGRGATAGQRPRCQGLSPATLLGHGGRLMVRDGPTWRRRGRGDGAGAMRSAWALFRRSRPWDVDIASRQTLEDPIETRRHPLGVVAVVITVSAIVFAGGFFLRLPPLPGLSSMCL